MDQARLQSPASQNVVTRVIDEQIDREAQRRATDISENKFNRLSEKILSDLDAQLKQRDAELTQEAQLALAEAIQLMNDIATTDILG